MRSIHKSVLVQNDRKRKPPILEARSVERQNKSVIASMPIGVGYPMPETDNGWAWSN